MEFFQFPHTPHIAWLGKSQLRGDKVLSPNEVREILARDIIVEEKVDGANVGLSVDSGGTLRAQNRGAFLSRDRSPRQFKPLFRWLDARERALTEILFPNLILFGEWCYAMHTVRYTRLPDWFLAFDIYDCGNGKFWSADRRDRLLSGVGLALVPRLGAGRFDMPALVRLLERSRLTDGPPEGLYLRRDDTDWLVARAKLVRPEFVQSIEKHWSHRSLEENRLESTSAAGEQSSYRSAG